MENAILTTEGIKTQLKELKAGRFMTGQLISLAGCGKINGIGTSSMWLEKDSNVAFCHPAGPSPTWAIAKLSETELQIYKGGEHGPGLGVCDDWVIRLVGDNFMLPYPNGKTFTYKVFDMSVIAFIGANGRYLRADDFISYSKSGSGYLVKADGHIIEKRSLWFIGIDDKALRGQRNNLLDSVEKLGHQLAGLESLGITFTEEELTELARQTGIMND